MNASSQTSLVPVQCVGTLTEDVRHAGAQTDAALAREAAPAAAVAASARFLRVAAPLLEAELRRAAASSALDALVSAARECSADGGGAVSVGAVSPAAAGAGRRQRLAAAAVHRGGVERLGRGPRLRIWLAGAGRRRVRRARRQRLVLAPLRRGAFSS